MLKLLLLFAALVLCEGSSMAQSRGQDPNNAQLQSCLIGTAPQTWTNLGLTSDQLERVRRVQEACKEDCEAAGAKQSADGISNEDGSFILAELRGILSAEQYRAWVEHCAGRSAASPK